MCAGQHVAGRTGERIEVAQLTSERKRRGHQRLARWRRAETHRVEPLVLRDAGEELQHPARLPVRIISSSGSCTVLAIRLERMSRSRTNQRSVRRSTSGTTAYAIAASARTSGMMNRRESRTRDLSAIYRSRVHPAAEIEKAFVDKRMAALPGGLNTVQLPPPHQARGSGPRPLPQARFRGGSPGSPTLLMPVALRPFVHAKQSAPAIRSEAWPATSET